MQGHIGYRHHPQRQDANAQQGSMFLYVPLASQYFQLWLAQLVQGIYKLLPNVVHDLKTQLLLLFKASTLITIPSISTLRSDVLVEFVHSVAELLQSMHKKLTFSNFKTKFG
jgi:hypothetical protein